MARVRSGFDPAVRHLPLPGLHTVVRYAVPAVVLAMVLASAVVLTRTSNGPRTGGQSAAARGGTSVQAAPAAPAVRAPSIETVAERAQPPLREAGAGDGWRLFVAADQVALPSAAEAMLAVTWDREVPSIDVLDRNGRIAVRFETGPAPMARLNPADNSLVVSDWVGAGEQARARLLVFDLGQQPAWRAEVTLPAQRVNFTTFANAIAVSADGDWFYWVEHDLWNIPSSCSSQSGQCDRMVVHAVSLETLEPSPLFAALPPGCSIAGMVPAGGSGILAGCADGSVRYLVDASPFAMGAVMESRAVFHAGWAERDAPGTDIFLRLTIASDGEVTAITVMDKLTGGRLTEWPLIDAWSVSLLDNSTALLLRADGRLEHLDIWTGDSVQLPYAIDPGAQGLDIALVR